LLPEAPYLHGSFCWADVATPDVAGAKAFYTALFGWTFDDQQMAGGTYSICMLEGGAVAGLYPASAEQAGTPCWFAYVAVDEVERTVADIEVLGGRVLAQPTELPGTGRMAVGADPEGAVFCLWQRDSPQPGYARLGLRPGIVCWNELAAGDTAASARFYARLFGWEARQAPTGEPPYVEFVRDGCLLAGMLPLAAIGETIPAHWLVYFAVADCDAAAATAQAQGGVICRPPFDVPEVGRIAVFGDPQGAVFAVVALAAAD
jgi:uncharacterized protein